MRRTLLAAILCLLVAPVAQAGTTIGLPQIPGLQELLKIAGLDLPSTLELPDLPAMPTLEGITAPAVPPPKPLVPEAASVPTAGAADTGKKADYAFAQNIFSLPDYRAEQIAKAKLPFIETINLERLRTYQKNRSACREAETKQQAYKNPADCPQYEHALPMSLLEDSKASAQALRSAWQRFEDRYYWRAMTELNNPALYIAFCSISWADGPAPSRPEATISVPKNNLPEAFDGDVTYPEPDPQFYLDNYTPLPQTPSEDYCDELNLELLPFMYIPGFCLYLFGEKIICTEDLGLKDEHANSEGTDPIWFNYEEGVKRVARAVARAHSTYLTQYQSDAMEALLPQDEHAMLFMTPWQSGLPDDGAFVAPVMNLDVDPSQFVTLAQTANRVLPGLEKYNAAAYYFQDLYRLPILDLHLMPGRNDALYTPPGLWRLEELKRWLAPSSLPYYERLGYTSFYQAWNEMTTTVLPEPLAAKTLRPLVYFAVGLDIYIDFTGISVGGSLSPIPVAPYLLPFAGPRMNWTWVSVPEGYDIPRVKGAPLFDYRSVLNPK